MTNGGRSELYDRDGQSYNRPELRYIHREISVRLMDPSPKRSIGLNLVVFALAPSLLVWASMFALLHGDWPEALGIASCWLCGLACGLLYARTPH